MKLQYLSQHVEAGEANDGVLADGCEQLLLEIALVVLRHAVVAYVTTRLRRAVPASVKVCTRTGCSHSARKLQERTLPKYMYVQNDRL